MKSSRVRTTELCSCGKLAQHYYAHRDLYACSRVCPSYKESLKLKRESGNCHWCGKEGKFFLNEHYRWCCSPKFQMCEQWKQTNKDNVAGTKQVSDGNCFYCENPAKYQLSNGKLCCESTAMVCNTLRRINTLFIETNEGTCSYCSKEAKFLIGPNRFPCCSKSIRACPEKLKLTKLFEETQIGTCKYCGQPANYLVSRYKIPCCMERINSCPARRVAAQANTTFISTQEGFCFYCEKPAKYVVGKSRRPCCSKTANACPAHIKQQSKNRSEIEEAPINLKCHHCNEPAKFLLGKKKQPCCSEKPYQCPKVRTNCIDAFQAKYGVDFPMHRPETYKKQAKSLNLTKEYVFPSGRTVRVRGYEPWALNKLLLDGILEDDIVVDTERIMPHFIYYGSDSKKHKYYPDILIKSKHQIIEVKSLWTYNEDVCSRKKQACLDAGYNFDGWIFTAPDKFVSF